MRKIKIIDKIAKRHPSYGTDKGWSWYVGGMRDTGEWNIRKMLDVPKSELKAFLNEIIKEENKPIIPPSEQELKDMSIIHEKDGFFYSEHTVKCMKALREDTEMKMLGLK